MKSIRDNPVKIRRKFDQTFKREAVENWLSSGKSAEVVARELGLLANRLYAWKKLFAPPDAGGRAARRRQNTPLRVFLHDFEVGLLVKDPLEPFPSSKIPLRADPFRGDF